MPASKPQITIEVNIKRPIDQVWHAWTNPEAIPRWNFASDDWFCPHATNDLKSGGRFSWRMEAKDGSFGFDFSGTYTSVIPHQLIVSLLDDDRTVSISFIEKEGSVRVVETFEAEATNSLDLQRTGWQAILDNFKKYVESL